MHILPAWLYWASTLNDPHCMEGVILAFYQYFMIMIDVRFTSNICRYICIALSCVFFPYSLD
jgi:hypothetical protein